MLTGISPVVGARKEAREQTKSNRTENRGISI
jgi:hypothetical protein